MRTIIIVSLALCLAACHTPQRDLDAAQRMATAPQSKTKGPSSGDAAADTSTNDMPLATAVGLQASEVSSNATAANYRPTNTNANTGSLVTGFVMGQTAAQQQQSQEFVAERLREDVALKAIVWEMAWLQDNEEYGDEWVARMDALKREFVETQAALVEALAPGGVAGSLDLSKLEDLVVVGYVVSNSGHTEREPTPEEAENLSVVLANMINAARDNSQILREGESVPTEIEDE
jgi:hypothetical protein